MRLLSKALSVARFATVRVTGRPIPVAVRINLNNRCHSRCQYCAFWSTPTEEMATHEVVRIVRDLAKLGTTRISYSGGEPMLRKDLGTIIEATADAGIGVELNSTGFLFDKRKDDLRRLELVKLSIDGPPDVHDAIRRRKTSFAELEGGIEVLRELGIKYSFAMTVTKDNLESVPFVVDFARRHGTFVAIQPVMAMTHASDETSSLLPDRARFREMIDSLIELKRREPGVLRNSLGGLRHVRGWPNIGGLKCYAGEALVMVEPNGNVVPCDRIPYGEPIPNCREHGIAWALERLPKVECEGCGFCGSVEINMLMNGRFDVLPAIGHVLSGARPNGRTPDRLAPRRRLPVVDGEP
ncbi:MAG: radical SAM/SPASM domain-containing protein [Sandaracinaceae bacterium]